MPLAYALEINLRRFQLTTLFDVVTIAYIGVFAGSYLVRTTQGPTRRVPMAPKAVRPEPTGCIARRTCVLTYSDVLPRAPTDTDPNVFSPGRRGLHGFVVVL